jgi:hypothetical protein
MAAQSGYLTTISNAFYTMAYEYSRTGSYYAGWTYTMVNNAIYTCSTTTCDSSWGMTSSDSSTLLSAWGTKVPTNAPVGTAFDTASLASGKTFEGNILGRGYQPGRYNVNHLPGLASWTQALLMGHETGHNYNGDHGNRGIASPGRATSSTHNHSYTVCDIGVAGICLQSHTVNDYYTHYTLMWPTIYGNSGHAEQFFDLGSTNQAWMRACDTNSFSAGSYTAGSTSGFGYYCLN